MHINFVVSMCDSSFVYNHVSKINLNLRLSSTFDLIIFVSNNTLSYFHWSLVTVALKQNKLEEIRKRNKDFAFGYNKECETKNKTVIPNMIKYLCLIYLNTNKDRFDPNFIHSDVNGSKT